MCLRQHLLFYLLVGSSANAIRLNHASPPTITIFLTGALVAFADRFTKISSSLWKSFPFFSVFCFASVMFGSHISLYLHFSTRMQNCICRFDGFTYATIYTFIGMYYQHVFTFIKTIWDILQHTSYAYN